MQHLRTLLSLILTNSEVRKLLSDFSVIGRDLLAKGAAKAAEALRPDEEAMAHVGEPASAGEFISRDGQKVGTGETPVLEVDIPRSDIRVEQHPRSDEPVVKADQGEEASGIQVLDKGKEAARSAHQVAADIGEHAREKAQQTKDSTESPG